MNARHPFGRPTHTGLAVLALAVAVGGCADRGDSAQRASVPSDPPTSVDHFELAAPGGCRARVDRWVDDDGIERLHGETTLRTAGGATTRVIEDVRLDRHGRLAQATVAARGDDAQLVEIDGERGVARVTSGRAAPIEVALPADAPWVYASLADGGAATSTPIAAYVAARAAARGEVVRRLDVAQRASHLVVADQVLVDDEARPVVVLGDDDADLDDAFVVRLSLRAAGITLRQVAPGSDGADLACL